MTGLPSRSLLAGRLTDYEIRRELADDDTADDRRDELEAELEARKAARAAMRGAR